MEVTLLNDFTLLGSGVVCTEGGCRPVELSKGSWCAVADGIFISRGKPSERKSVWHPARQNFWPRCCEGAGE